MIYFVVAFVALLVGFYFAQRADALVSEEGFKQGYQEGTEIITKFFGPKPTLKQLTLFNFTQMAVLEIPAVVMVACSIPFAYTMGWFLVIPVAAALHHLRGVQKWRRAFASHGASLDGNLTAWQKILGW
jgi:hypothetical protein